MKAEKILKKALINLLRKSPATLDLVMDCCTDLILERTEKNFDIMLLSEKIAADDCAEQMKAMIFNS